MPLSPQGTIESNSINSDAAWLVLLRFTLPGEPPLLVCNNTEPVISRGETYEPTYFEIVLPTDDGDSLPEVKLAIQNVDGRILEWVRGFSTAPILTMELVLSTQPDVVERSIDYLRLEEIDYDALTITGTMRVENVMSAAYGDTYNPVQFPGLHS